MVNNKIYVLPASPNEAALIEELSKHFPEGTEELFRKGIILMGVLMREVKNGNKVAILDKNDKIIDYVDGLI